MASIYYAIPHDVWLGRFSNECKRSFVLRVETALAMFSRSLEGNNFPFAFLNVASMPPISLSHAKICLPLDALGGL